MAFQTSSTSRAPVKSNDDWQAAYFLNLNLPSGNGNGDGTTKFGAIPLRDAYANEKELSNWLLADPVVNMAKLLSKIQVSYNPAGQGGYGAVPKLITDNREGKAKTLGYINFHLPIASGETRQLGVVVLHELPVSEANMNAWLADPKDGDANLQKLSNDMTIVHQSAVSTKTKATVSNMFDMS